MSVMGRLGHWLGVFVVGLAPVACGQPGLGHGDDDESTGTSQSGTSQSGTSESGESGETGETGPLLRGEPTIVHHPKQPMVVDVLVELDAPGTGELRYGPDDDVRVFQLAPAPGEAATTLHFRVRGLLPDTDDHQLELDVSEAAGPRADSWSDSFTTNPALPGFIAKFEIESLGSEAVDPVWRLFDMTRLFSTDAGGVFLVDDEGTTRWYLGDADDSTDLDDICQGLQLRADGSVSFTRRDAGVIVDELGNELMHVDAATIGASAGLHHDMIELPNGNFMVLGYAFADVDYAGEGTLHVAGDMIHEFTPSGELVWTWNTFDHLDPQRRRDDFYILMQIPDPDAGIDGYDWTHGNGLAYTADDDTVYLSMRHQDWIVAIDHQTGEIRWRLGDEGDFALVGERWFFHQHSPEWQADGSLLLYDNAVGNPDLPDSGAHSRAVRYALDFDSMTATELWSDDDPPFRSSVAGDADTTAGGHVLRLDSAWTDDQQFTPSSRLRELDPQRTPNAVWTLYMPPGQFSYRAVPVDRFVGEPQ